MVEAGLCDLWFSLEPVQSQQLGGAVAFPRSRRSLEYDALEPVMRQMLEEGLSYSEVARTLKVSRQALVLRLPGYGWTKSDGGRFGMTNRYAQAEIKRVWQGIAG